MPPLWSGSGTHARSWDPGAGPSSRGRGRAGRGFRRRIVRRCLHASVCGILRDANCLRGEETDLMELFRWFSVVVVASVLAGTAPTLAQDIPDDATRARVADWLDRCGRSASDACLPVIERIAESARGRRCRVVEWSWDAARLVRDPENAHFVDEAVGRREKAREFIAECVPIYAAALRETDERDNSSGDTAYRGPVEPVDRVMQAVKRSNLRSGPGITHDRVGLLDIGDEVRVTGEVGDWLRIEAPGGGEAFIYGPLLAEVTPDQVTTAGEREPEPASDTVAVTETVGAEDMPDAATRERVADWIERCDRPSDACWPVIERIRESALGRWCREVEYQLDTVRVVRDPENAPYFVEEAYGRLEKAKDFIKECVTVYATAMDSGSTPDQVTPEGTNWSVTENQPCHVWNYGYIQNEPFTWSGACLDGKASGQGTLTLWGGDLVYEGGMRGGKPHGYGTLRFADGAVHEGSYVDGERHGQWVERLAGDVFEGPYVDSKRHGQWVWRFVSGAVYEGPYVDGERHGQWVERKRRRDCP